MLKLLFQRTDTEEPDNIIEVDVIQILLFDKWFSEAIIQVLHRYMSYSLILQISAYIGNKLLIGLVDFVS